jgi:hypothetical protein
VKVDLLLEYCSIYFRYKKNEMTDENLLMQKCLEITSHVLNNDQRAFINIKIGNSFCFTFNNQETSIDARKKSPSVLKRDNERKELFKENMKEEKFESNEVDAENKDIEDIVDDNCQIWKVKVFTDDIERLQHHVQEEKDSKVFKYSSKPEDQHRGGAIQIVKSFQKCQSKDGNYAIMEFVLDLSRFSISFVENTRGRGI